MRDPDISGLFVLFCIYFIRKLIWSWDNTAKRNIDTGHTGLFWCWAVFGCSFCVRDWTALFVPFFGLFQIIFRIIFASFVPKLLFLSKSERLLGDFQIIFLIIFASFVPGLTNERARSPSLFFPFVLLLGPFFPATDGLSSSVRIHHSVRSLYSDCS